jgi:hypothetical protein
MNELIKRLTKDHLQQYKYVAYGEVIEGDYYKFDEKELLELIEKIIDECIDYAAAEGDQVWYLANYFGFK